MQTQQYYRMPDLLVMMPVSKYTIHKMVREGDFPHPVKLSKRATGWPVAEVQQWMERKAQERMG